MIAKKIAKGYCTKYALTAGIVQVTVACHGDDAEPAFRKYVTTTDFGTHICLIKGRTFFEDKEEAIKAARDMAKKKAESLRKAIKKLDAMAKQQTWEIKSPEDVSER